MGMIAIPGYVDTPYKLGDAGSLPVDNSANVTTTTWAANAGHKNDVAGGTDKKITEILFHAIANGEASDTLMMVLVSDNNYTVDPFVVANQVAADVGKVQVIRHCHSTLSDFEYPSTLLRAPRPGRYLYTKLLKQGGADAKWAYQARFGGLDGVRG